jgi:hypothetical protein
VAADTLRDIRWVAENIDREGLEEKDAPGSGAWAMLRQYRKSEESRRDFFVLILPKLLPTRQDMGGVLRDREANASVERAIRACLKVRAAVVKKGVEATAAKGV